MVMCKVRVLGTFDVVMWGLLYMDIYMYMDLSLKHGVIRRVHARRISIKKCYPPCDCRL